MIDLSGIDYHQLDRLRLNKYLFYPRPDYGSPSMPAVDGASAEDVLIPVEGDVAIGATFHTKQKEWPNILFFHGNGEIVADYKEVAPLFLKAGLNFLAVDYRGYGRSNGSPSITDMMRDCHRIFAYVCNWLNHRGHDGALIIMGRSLGSASALELVASYGDKIDGLILESSFALTRAVLDHFDVNMDVLGLTEENGFRNLDKIRTFAKPTLIIHGEFDPLLPLAEGQALYHASPSPDKVFLKIPRAAHDAIFCFAMKTYIEAVKEFAAKVASSR